MSRPPQTFSPPNLFELGIGTVVIIRYKSGGRVEAGVFLLDVFCLGVKKAFFDQCHEDELPEFFKEMFQGATPDEHSGAWGIINRVRVHGLTLMRKFVNPCTLTPFMRSAPVRAIKVGIFLTANEREWTRMKQFLVMKS